MLAELSHYIPIFVEIIKRPTMDKLMVIAVEVLLTSSTFMASASSVEVSRIYQHISASCLCYSITMEAMASWNVTFLPFWWVHIIFVVVARYLQLRFAFSFIIKSYYMRHKCSVLFDLNVNYKTNLWPKFVYKY